MDEWIRGTSNMVALTRTANIGHASAGDPKALALAWTGGVDWLLCLTLAVPQRGLGTRLPHGPLFSLSHCARGCPCESWCHLFQGQMKAVTYLDITSSLPLPLQSKMSSFTLKSPKK